MPSTDDDPDFELNPEDTSGDDEGNVLGYQSSKKRKATTPSALATSKKQKAAENKAISTSSELVDITKNAETGAGNGMNALIIAAEIAEKRNSLTSLGNDKRAPLSSTLMKNQATKAPFAVTATNKDDAGKDLSVVASTNKDIYGLQ